MNKKTLLAGALFAGLLGLTMMVLKSPDKGVRTGESERPIAKLDKDAFDTLTITRDGKSTTVVRKGDSYAVTEPVAYAAEADAAKEAFDAIAGLKFGSVVTDQKSKHAEMEVDDASLKLDIKKGSTLVATLRIGKVNGNQTLVRVEGKDAVWQAVGSLKWKFDKDAAAWRDKTVLKFEEDKATRLEVVAKDGSKIVMERAAAPAVAAGAPSAPPAEWTLKESSIKIDPLDKTIASGLINALYSFRATDFADGAAVGETGLDAPALKVSVTVGGGVQSLWIGNKKGEEDFYVQKEGNPQVFLAKKYSLDHVNKRPIEFREKVLCNLPESELTQVDVSRKSEPFQLVRTGASSTDWKFAKPAAELDTSKHAAVLAAFAELKATAMAESFAPAATGLDKPSATIVAKSKLKGGCTLKVGKTTADDQSYNVQTSGREEVFLVPKYTLDRVLVKLDELKKK
ncbi:MAG: DUF4340 domain-containing protein [Deltaproteobacteria bacterium]|nr:DUF4340 domain-containing protein [Deltaproteobacteria bacterium]